MKKFLLTTKDRLEHGEEDTMCFITSLPWQAPQLVDMTMTLTAGGGHSTAESDSGFLSS